MPPEDDFATELRGDMRISNDGAGFTLFFQWLMGIAAVIVSTALIWVATSVAQLREDMAVLKDRPQPVTKAEFDLRMESVERWNATVEKRLSALEARK
jgi:hypothetical protein